MVKERHPLHVGVASNVDHVLHRAVSPPRLLRVLVAEVLRIVDQEIGALEEAGVGEIVTAPRDVAAAAELRLVRLVVRGVDHRGSVDLEPIPEGERGVVQVHGANGDVTDLE